MGQLVKECSAVLARCEHGGFINSHSGIDCWRTEQASHLSRTTSRCLQLQSVLSVEVAAGSSLL
jgi:hypothetical protein